MSSPFFFSSRRRHTRYIGDWSSDVCSSDLRIGRHVNAANSFVNAVVGGWQVGGSRSEERRVGKEWRSREAQDPLKNEGQHDRGTRSGRVLSNEQHGDGHERKSIEEAQPHDF